jgi:hypothetical protein
MFIVTLLKGPSPLVENKADTLLVRISAVKKYQTNFNNTIKMLLIWEGYRKILPAKGCGLKTGGFPWHPCGSGSIGGNRCGPV